MKDAERRISRADVVYCAVSIALLLAVALHWHHAHTVIASVDISPQVDYWWQLRSGFLAWNYSSSPFGSISTGLGVLPYLALGSALQAIMGASWTQVIILWILLSASWLGTYVFVRRLRLSPLAAFVAATGYVLNPYEQLQISVVTFAWMLAILPWLAWLLLFSLQQPAKWRRAVVIAAALALFGLSVLSITPQLLFETAVNLVVLFVCLTALVARPPFYWRRFVTGAVVAMLLVSLWWLLPLVLASTGSKLTHAVATSSNAWVYARSTLLNNLRFSYTWAWPAEYGYFPFTESYDSNPLTYLAGFALFAGALGSLIVTRGSVARLVRRLLIASLAMMFIAKGLHPPLGGINEWFLHVPLMFLYQEPGGATGLAIFCLAVCCAVLVDECSARVHAKVIIGAGLSALFAVSAVAMVSGAIYHGPDRGLPSMYVRIPDYWKNAAHFMDAVDKRGDRGTALILPADKIYEAFYSFGYYGLDAVPNIMLRRPVLSLGASLGYFSDDIAASLSDRVQRLIEAQSPLLPSMLRALHIRYVVVRGDVVAEEQAVDDASALGRILHTTVRNFGPLAVLVVPDSDATSATLESRYTAGAYANWTAGDREELSALLQELPGVDQGAIPPTWSPPAALSSDVSDEGTIGHSRGRPHRQVWRGVGSLGIGVADADHGEVRSSFSTTARVRSDVTVPLAIGKASVSPPLKAITPRLDHIVTARDSYNVVIQYSSGAYKLFIVNPNSEAVRTTLRIALAAPFEVRARVQWRNGSAVAVAPSSAYKPVWVDFPHVNLNAGYNVVGLQLRAEAHAERAGVVTVATPAMGFREFAVSFAGTQFAAGRPKLTPQLFLGAVPVGAIADSAPRLALTIDGGSLDDAPAGALLHLQRGRMQSWCYSPLRNGGVDLAQAVIDCNRGNGHVATLQDLRQTEIVSADVTQIRIPGVRGAWERIAGKLTGASLTWRPNLALPTATGESIPLAGPMGLPFGAIVGAAATPLDVLLGRASAGQMLGDAPAQSSGLRYVTPEQIHRVARNAAVTLRPRFHVALQRIYRESQGFTVLETPHGNGISTRFLAATESTSLVVRGRGSQSVGVGISTRQLPLGMELLNLPKPPGLLVTPVRYGPLWSAFYVRGFGHRAIHTEANAWRNAWFVEGGGTLLIFNDLNIIVVVLQIAAVALVIIGLFSVRRDTVADE